MKSNFFTRTDSETVKQTIQIYQQELDGEKRDVWLGITLIPLQYLLYTVLLPLLVSFFLQSLITDQTNIQTPLWLLGGMVIISIASVACGYGYSRYFTHQERMATKLTERSLRSLLSHSHSFFSNTKVGSLSGDINTFAKSYLTVTDAAVLQASSIFVNFIASIVVIAFIAPILLPAVILLTGLILFEAYSSYNKRSKYRNQRKDLMSKLYGNIADVIGNQTLVRMFSRQNDEISSILTQRHHVERIARKEIQILQRSSERRFAILFTFQITLLGLCLYLTSHSLISIAALIFVVTYLGRVTSSMFSIAGIVRAIEQGFLDAAKMTEILQKTPEVLDVKNAKKLTLTSATVQLKSVVFSYNNQDENVFTKLNLNISSKQSVGLAGKSGGGKSTLTQLLLRYMDVQSGEILIDEQNIAKVTQNSLREQISYVPQDPYLFHRSLRDNITYGKEDASDKEIDDAITKAHAKEFIDKLPDGLDTIVGERGVKLSGGQRQRVAIARAILKDAPILILDEATSALDSESERLIQSALENLMKDRTSIVIAHRLSTIAKLDRIIVLDNGKIIEDGTHAKLLKQSGTYAKLWSHQSGGFIEE